MDMTELQVLKGVYDHISMRRISVLIGKTLRTVQRLCFQLEKEGYISNPWKPGEPRVAVARTLTAKGKLVLAQEGLIPYEKSNGSR
jgi:transposase